MVELPLIEKVKTLQVILKVAEVCNIDCTYCYYYAMGSSPSTGRPHRFLPASVGALADWLNEAAKDYSIEQIDICFHGGEPLMTKPAEIDHICTQLVAQIKVATSFQVQTNGTLISEDWLEVFDKHRFHVGVSIDGDRKSNDRFRLDRKGLSTFDRTIRGIEMVQRTIEQNNRVSISTITVLNAEHDPDELYEFLRGLRIQRMDFLLPDASHSIPREGVGDKTYGRIMFGVLNAWLLEDDPSTDVRFARVALEKYIYRSVEPGNIASSHSLSNLIVVVHSDMGVSIDDSLVPASPWYEQQAELKIGESTLRDFVTSEAFSTIREAYAEPPNQCMGCEEWIYCRAGDLENRYSHETGFKNASVYCEDYKHFWASLKSLLNYHNEERSI